MILYRTTIEIELRFPAYYLAADALSYCFALHLQQIMDLIEQKELAAGHHVRSIEGTINHETGEAWITMLTLERATSRGRYTKDFTP